MHRSENPVKAELVKKGISLSFIASASGEDVRTVSHVLKGRRRNRALNVLQHVAMATGKSLTEIEALVGVAS